jgi:2,4-dienoyl-CoA reductase-like NADH-dependent reductase (Old Yellow Enzyme family)/thioredoxin reductase
VLVTAHVPQLAKNGRPDAEYVAYHRARARGGVGMQITGATPVHESSALHSQNAIHNLDDSVIPGYRMLADAVHAEGGTMLAQLAHYGATMEGGGEAGRVIWGPSQKASEVVRQIPHEMTIADIKVVVDAFGAAADRVKAGGMDGVEILAAFGLLIASFLSPYSNRRTDRYGGSVENRMRLAVEVAEAVRGATGRDLIVGMRVPGDEYVEGGLDTAAMQEITRKLEATGLVDYFNVAAGTNMDRVMRAAHWPPTPAPHGLYAHLAADIKKAVKLPVFAVGRIVDPAHANRLVAEGKADMVGMTRAHIADPEIVAKVKAGHPEEIRPCVGANVCIAKVQAGGPVRCIQNPETAREHIWGPAKPARKAKTIAVIGSGPAGLEAARVAALRGHRVTVYEKDAVIGGQFLLRTSIPVWKEFESVLTWRRRELEKMQVRIELGREIKPEDVAKLGADTIILATGAEPAVEPVAGMENSSVEVATPHDVVRHGRPDARIAVIWDAAGGYVGTGVVEALIAAGSTVHVVTPAFAAYEDIDLIQRVPIYQRVLSAGVKLIPTSEIASLDGNAVIVRNVYSGETHRIEQVDLLVSWQGNRSMDGLRDAILAAGIELQMAGDCVAPRTADVAIAEGALAARSV